MIVSDNPSPGLYVHIPFCRTKCPYCDFYSVSSPELISPFLEALGKEAQLYKDSLVPFDSLYLGGGTPSLLDASQLNALVACLRRHFDFAPDTEFTLEANPDDVTAEKLQLFPDLGVNRLSLGVQSFNEAELIFLQRRHTARQTLAALELIRAAGFGNLGLDLMYGLPGQSLEAWRQTLETALSFTPEHLSCYQLTIAEGTPLGRQAARDELSLPDEETQRAFFLLTHEFLEEHGYLHYEISNFARREAYCCRHNQKYWRHLPYLGLGPAAHSFKDGRRWWNFSSLERYCSAINAGLAPVAGAEILTQEQLRLEAIYLGFRARDGVPLEIIRQKPRWQIILSELQEAGLVTVLTDRVLSTPQGLVVADRLPLLFVD
jgi:putative oxygen-independent coproporphyrinogen III oxidase